MRIPLILKNGENLARAEEHWEQYSLDLIAEDFGHAQAHSLNGVEAEVGKTWVLLARPEIEGWHVSDLTENDYMKWDGKRAVEARDAEITARLAKEATAAKQAIDDKAVKERARKSLKKAGVTVEDLRAIFFGE